MTSPIALKSSASDSGGTLSPSPSGDTSRPQMEKAELQLYNPTPAGGAAGSLRDLIAHHHARPRNYFFVSASQRVPRRACTTCTFPRSRFRNTVQSPASAIVHPLPCTAQCGES